MAKPKDHTGERFGRLVVLSEVERGKNGRNVLCKCDCGKEKTFLLKSITGGHTKSCGCLRSEIMSNGEARRGRIKNLMNYQFGNSIVLRFDGIKKKEAHWLCLCQCGKLMTKSASSIQSGRANSCGCGHNKSRTIHGGGGKRIYGIYTKIQQRCYNKECSSFPHYGGRGIICEWKTYQEFAEDMLESYVKHCNEFGEKNTSIDRIDVNGNYSKENCKRATPKEQISNRRRKYNMIEIGEIFGISTEEVKNKINQFYNLKTKNELT